MIKNYNPVPQSWVYRKNIEKRNRPRDVVSFGRMPSLGSKARLRFDLANSGWGDIYAIDDVLVTNGQQFTPINNLKDVEGMFRQKEAKPEDGISIFKELGIQATYAGSVTRPSAIWESLTSNPWWAATRTQSEPRVLILMGSNTSSLERMSLGFVYDLWRSLGGAPEYRMPRYKRLPMEYLSKQVSTGVIDHIKDTHDLLVVTGGNFSTEDSSFSSVMELFSLRASFGGGFIIYELLLPDSNEDELVIMKNIHNLLRKCGFNRGTSYTFAVTNRSVTHSLIKASNKGKGNTGALSKLNKILGKHKSNGRVQT